MQITPSQFQKAFTASVRQVPVEKLRTDWVCGGKPFTCLMKYGVLVRVAPALSLNSAQEYCDIDSVFYEVAVEAFSVAIEHEHDNKDVLRSEIPKLLKVRCPLKVLIVYTRTDAQLTSLPSEYAQTIRSSNTHTEGAEWLLLVGDPRREHPSIVWDPYVYSESSGFQPL